MKKEKCTYMCNKGENRYLSNKGFTLIELLAVIVILAIIALIATPIILNIINDAKKGAAKASINNYKKAADLAYADYITKTGKAPVGVCNDVADPNADCTDKLRMSDIKYSGSTVNCDIFEIGDNEIYLSGCVVGENSTEIIMDGDIDYSVGKITTLSQKILSDNNAIMGNQSDDTVISTNCEEKQGYIISGGSCNVLSADKYGWGQNIGSISQYYDLNGNLVTIDKNNCTSIPKNFNVSMNVLTFLDNITEIEDTSSCPSTAGTSGCLLNVQTQYECSYTPSGLFYTNQNTEDNKNSYYFTDNVTNNYVKFGGQYTYSYGEQKWKTLGYESYDACYSGIIASETEKFNAQGYCMLSFTDVNGVSQSSGLTSDFSVCEPYIQKYAETACYDNLQMVTKDLMWRILRINEDGSIRLISEEAIGKSHFNGISGDYISAANKKYVGYMYGTDDDPYKNKYDSVAKTYLDNFYESQLLSYSKYIADSGFCNDRTISSTSGNTIYYGTASGFACPQKKDLFTVSNSKGNQALKYPIGLPTKQEIIKLTSDASDYNINFWTMSPTSFYNTFSGTPGYSEVAFVHPGAGGNYPVSSLFGMRPVINIKSTIPFVSGSGTKTDPYIVG